MRDVLTDLLELVGTLDDRVAGLLLTVDDLRERVGAAERWRAAQAGRAFEAAHCCRNLHCFREES